MLSFREILKMREEIVRIFLRVLRFQLTLQVNKYFYKILLFKPHRNLNCNILVLAKVIYFRSLLLQCILH